MELRNRKIQDRDEGDVSIDFDLLEVTANVVRASADYTAPVKSYGFFILLAIGAYFHESHFMTTGIVLTVWGVIQILGSALDEDFQTDLFWGIVGIASRVLMYVVVGIVWVVVKVNSDVLTGPVSAHLMSAFNACATPAEKFAVMLPLMTQWTLTWPMNMVHVFTRNPLQAITASLLRMGETYFIAAFESLFDPVAAKLGWSPLWVVCGVLSYFVIGYLFTHLKLFFDVWQGTLPKKLDKQVRDVYDADGSYWEFIVNIKWMVMRWMITWPFEATWMVLRHPVRILIETVYEFSQRKYVWITAKAMELRKQKQPNE